MRASAPKLRVIFTRHTARNTSRCTRRCSPGWKKRTSRPSCGHKTVSSAGWRVSCGSPRRARLGARDLRDALRHQRAQGIRGAHPATRLSRHIDRPLRCSSTAWTRPSRRWSATSARWRCSTSTSTGSSSSMIPWDITSATACWRRPAPACAGSCAPKTRWRGSVATSSWWCCRMSSQPRPGPGG